MEVMKTVLVAMLVVATIQMLPCNGYNIGVNYGTLGDNLPSPGQVVSLYKKCGIELMRLFEPKQEILEALRSSGLKVSLGVRNEDLQLFSTSPEAVQSWVSQNIVPYAKDVVFGWVTLGNEVVPGPLGGYVAPAMANMRAALDSVGLASTKVSTVVPGSVLGASYPPSAGAFSGESLSAMTEIASFLQRTGSPLIVNVYPYFAHASNPADIPLDYAMFDGKTAVVDGGLQYFSLFDAIVDAVYAALERIGAGQVGLVVGETGWPSAGSDYATIDNAQLYNSNMFTHVMRVGTPRRPGVHLQAFVFAMFNENLKPAGVEQNFGLFHPDMTPVYPLFLSCA